ncbi:hypothetical protein I6N90_01805 [Paenibacillus sp. GSMTC-2017]|uniref:DUF7408 domain-containing protein n=1 Tax=Paenibacillus sp. GSMTC-2017 TaxID=2794350 RepID=UPI0018D988B0|nr:hypothetical protein [Paenibacillus sp. GSMTC-2017]MBH5316539.1 hypothetical protein [Paenibacillus sp. GSMTC-2017]
MNVRLSRAHGLIALMLVLTCLMSAFSMSEGVSADKSTGGIEVQSQVGYTGSIKEDKWIPIKLTLTNKTDESLKGEVVLSVVTIGNVPTDFVIPVELPKDTAIKVAVSIPGSILNKETNRIRFFEGSYKKGKEVSIIGANYLSARTMQGYTIGVVSRDPDTLNFMPALNQKGYNISVIPLAIEDLPEDAIMLDAIDTLVINDVDSGQWTTSTIKAIKDWVTKGGTLVLSGGAGYTKTAEAFKDIAPVEASGITELKSTNALAAIGDAELKLDQPITISNGRVVSGSIGISEQGVPIAVESEVGFGSVVYVAYDPSLEPMATWSGNADVWARLLQRTLFPQQPGTVSINYGNGFGGVIQDMNYIIDMFPSIKAPKFILLLGMFALYMILVAPILYFILSKTDRREWAWWMIPAFSVVMGIAIFYFGAADKRTISAHTVEIIELSKDGKAVVSGGSGLFLPSGGSVSAAFEDKRPIALFADHSGNGGLTLDSNYQVKMDEDSSTVNWKSVSYWSTRKLWMERRAVESAETGTMAIKYEHKDGDTIVHVTNNTTSDLTNVTLLVNGQTKPIGQLKIGESGSVQKIASSYSNQNGHYSYGHMIFSNTSSNGRTDNNERQRQLINNYFNRSNGITNAVPTIIGFSIDHKSQYEVNGKKVKSDNLKMWVQELDQIEQIGNRVVVPEGVLRPIITTSTMTTFENYGTGIRVGTGEIVMEYLVPNSYSVAYDKIDVQINNNGGSNLTWSIWHEVSGKWVTLNGELAAPKDYFVDGQSIKIKLEAATETQSAFPDVVLEGEELQQ